MDMLAGKSPHSVYTRPGTQSNGSFSGPYFLNSLTWYFTSKLIQILFHQNFPVLLIFSTLRHRVAMIFWECFVFCPKTQPPNQINRLPPNWNRISRATLTSQDKIQESPAIRIPFLKALSWNFYLSSGNSMMVWNFPCSAAGPSPTSMYLFSVTIGELACACVLAWASSRLSSLVEGEETNRDLGLDKAALKKTNQTKNNYNWESHAFAHKKIKSAV